jgi:hypothetical protein
MRRTQEADLDEVIKFLLEFMRTNSTKDYFWWPLESLVKQTGFTEVQILAAIAKSKNDNLLRESAQKFYTTCEAYDEFTSWWTKLVDALNDQIYEN